MKVNERIYYFKDGEMKLFSSYVYTYKINNINRIVKKWYALHPYAKKLNDTWICGDYRIDQQRPQRKVYSEAYLKIISITKMERKVLNELINERESKIKYPCVWDDGKNRYYEDVIHCPKCGKFRTSLSSETHCEYCGFEFKQAKKCPKCKDLSPIGSKFCIHCGQDFSEKVVKKSRPIIRCSECEKQNDGCNNYCINCGHKLKKISVKDEAYRTFCVHCGTRLKDDEFCSHCGQMVWNNQKTKVCPICGELCGDERYCWNCGHDNNKFVKTFGMFNGRKCLNCDETFESWCNYCDVCGAKLGKNKDIIKEMKKAYNEAYEYNKGGG